MTKTIFIVLVVLAALGGGYFYFSNKPIIQINVQLQPTPPSSENAESQTAPLMPIAGKMITIRDCKGEPQILQTNEDDEITFMNADGAEHTIFIAGANETLQLSAKGSIKYIVRRASVAPANLDFTDNYTCDSTVSSGGAIYIPAQ